MIPPPMSQWQEQHDGAGSSSRAGAGEARACGYSTRFAVVWNLDGVNP